MDMNIFCARFTLSATPAARAEDYARFVGLLARRLAARPWASAANFPAGKAPTEDARGADRLARGAWLEWVNKPKELSAMLLEMKHGAAVRCVAYGADGRRMASGGMDGRVVVWDAASGAEVAAMEHGGGTVFGVALSADPRAVQARQADAVWAEFRQQRTSKVK